MSNVTISLLIALCQNQQPNPNRPGATKVKSQKAPTQSQPCPHAIPNPPTTTTIWDARNQDTPPDSRRKASNDPKRDSNNIPTAHFTCQGASATTGSNSIARCRWRENRIKRSTPETRRLKTENRTKRVSHSRDPPIGHTKNVMESPSIARLRTVKRKAKTRAIKRGLLADTVQPTCKSFGKRGGLVDKRPVP